MTAFRISAMAILALFLCALCASAEEVKTDYDHHVNFTQYHSYYWEKVKTSDPLWEGRIRDAVDHELQAKGWTRMENGGDVAVTAVGSAHAQQEYETFYNGMGGWRWGGFGETTTQVDTYHVGSLVLDFYDAHNKQLIWRGVASDTLSANPAKNEKKLDKSVDKMLEKFPPHA